MLAVRAVTQPRPPFAEKVRAIPAELLQQYYSHVRQYFNQLPLQTPEYTLLCWNETLDRYEYRCEADRLADLLLLALALEPSTPGFLERVFALVNRAETYGFLTWDPWLTLVHARGSQRARYAFLPEEELWTYREVCLIQAHTGFTSSAFFWSSF